MTTTFDAKADEFVIHTPTISATKGVDYGTKTFIVPLCDPHNFQLLPGVNTGNIRKKMGRDGITEC
ncbi:hypothetical protein CROQUDRAFT_98813 [Cronartium quercuum f. sp. fusiforme G11]|uniref:Uncharacterized protein n=1 Tax=Cronartium quercuum f. sp. fusiforme G11 TaxID=708437 RepID=A0A9P6NBX8_9BASI|nr:hypothetical protein CROQUDRAFT_98813 [Cronartium quercuum f. sp. fusiforme G11]